MSQNRWRSPHQVCLTDEEFKAVKLEAARCNPPMPFSAWMRMVVMAQVERNRQAKPKQKDRGYKLARERGSNTSFDERD